jgi:hypothetical protein
MWDMFFRVGLDSKPIKQELEAMGAHMEAAGKKIGKRFGLSWTNVIAGAVIGAGVAIGKAFGDAMTNAVENVRGSAKFGVNLEDFHALKVIAEETGASMEVMADALKRGGKEAAALRQQMAGVREGIDPEVQGWLKVLSDRAAGGWQNLQNATGAVGAAATKRLSILEGAQRGFGKGVKSLFSGGGFSGFYDELTTGIAEGATADDTAKANAVVAAGTVKMVEIRAKKIAEAEAAAKKAANAKPTKVKGDMDDGSTDALARVGILYSRFGMQSRREKWEDEMLSATKAIERNTANSGAGGPPGPITL